MQVIHLADFGGVYPGSFVALLTATAEAAAKRSVETRVVFSSSSRGRPWLSLLTEAGIRTDFAPDGGRRRVADWIRDLVVDSSAASPTVLHTHFTRFDVPSLSAAGMEGTRLIWHLHTRMREDPLARARARAKFLIARRRVDLMLCAGHQVWDAAVRAGAPRRRLVSLPNAIDLERFRPASPASRAEARQRVGVEADRTVLLHFGWDWEVKGGALAIETLTTLLAGASGSGSGRPLLISVGGGEAARRAFVAAGLEPTDARVLEPVQDPRELYHAADVFLCSSIGEGDPFAVLEALASGTPVASVPLPGLREASEGTPLLRLSAERSAGALAAVVADAAKLSARQRDGAVAATRTWLAEHRSLASRAEQIAQLEIGLVR